MDCLNTYAPVLVDSDEGLRWGVEDIFSDIAWMAGMVDHGLHRGLAGCMALHLRITHAWHPHESSEVKP